MPCVLPTDEVRRLHVSRPFHNHNIVHQVCHLQDSLPFAICLDAESVKDDPLVGVEENQDLLQLAQLLLVEVDQQHLRVLQRFQELEQLLLIVFY